MRSLQGLFLVALLVAVSEARVLKNETGNSTGCSKDPAVMNATEKLGEMDAGEDMDAFMDQVHEMRDAIQACRDKKADKASDNADAEMEEYEEHPMMQDGLAFTTIENKIVTALDLYCQKADPKKKKADKADKGNSSKGGPCSQDCCKDKEVLKVKGELAKLKPGQKKGFMKKVFELQDAVQACRAKSGEKATKKADAAMKKYEDENPLVDEEKAKAALLEQDPCAGCDTGLAQAYQTCASKHGNACAETNAAGIVGKGPGAKKDIGCCMKKEKHDRCLKCAGMDCAHGTCKVNKKYYSTYTIVGKLDDKKAMKKAGWGK